MGNVGGALDDLQGPAECVSGVLAMCSGTMRSWRPQSNVVGVVIAASVGLGMGLVADLISPVIVRFTWGMAAWRRLYSWKAANHWGSSARVASRSSRAKRSKRSAFLAVGRWRTGIAAYRRPIDMRYGPIPGAP